MLDALNLRVTSRRIEELVDEAREKRRKTICFVTGVPGSRQDAGWVERRDSSPRPDKPTHARISVRQRPAGCAVLSEALTRDEVIRRKKQGEKVRKGKVAESVKAFIQNVHHFRDDALIESGPPIEHVVIFDEAQRAMEPEADCQFHAEEERASRFCAVRA